MILISLFKFFLQVQRFVEAWIQGTDGVTYTPGGLAWANQWGSLRFVGNAAMIASVYAKNVASKPHPVIMLSGSPTEPWS